MSLCLMSVVLTMFATSTISAQGVIPYEGAQRGGVRRFDSRSSGVRHEAPGVREFGNTQHAAGPSYFGIMGAVPAGHAGTYSSPQRRIELGLLVQSANGLSNNATGMAQIIRNGRVAIHVFPNANELPQLLPGDLVVFQKEIAQPQPGQDQGEGVQVASGTVGDGSVEDENVVEVAFVGIIGSRPIIVPLDANYATIGYVLEALHQQQQLARSIRVIRTDSRRGLLEPGRLPERLVDGDVLVFDPRQLDPSGLSQAQEFPPAIPINGAAATSLWNDTGDHTADVNMHRPAPAIDVAPQLTIPTDSEAPSPSAEPARTFEESPLPVLDFSSTDPESGLPFAPMIGEPADQPTMTASVEPVSHDVRAYPSESTMNSPELSPVPEIAVPERPAAHHHAQPAPVASVAEPSIDLFPELASPPDHAETNVTTGVQHDSAEHLTPASEPIISDVVHGDAIQIDSIPGAALLTQASAAVPAPRDATLSSIDDGKLAHLRSLNTASIALAVLVLAAMCFVVSIIWSRIDRTAQTMQQELPRRDKADTNGRRKTLDRLIENELPIIEERAVLIKQTDYHGKEVGKKRLMIDPAHSLAGPHFATEASKEQQRRSKVKTRRRTPLADPHAVESRLDRAVEHVRTFRRDEHVETEQNVDAQEAPPTPTEAHVESRDQSQSNTGLLDRVLVAMQRERRR
ncbi:MAG: hypothetical protein KDA93_00075 [Planctomycetaceae bacterium]|nr:hypothetical protein [Planctomycetaceae bacterium]